jgi:hypothetical protein
VRELCGGVRRARRAGARRAAGRRLIRSKPRVAIGVATGLSSHRRRRRTSRLARSGGRRRLDVTS